MLYSLQFPYKFIKWVIEFIKTIQYRIAINGGLFGNIKERWGHKQGDSISPLLLVIYIEYFSRLIEWIASQEGFQYYSKCRSLRLNHSCFADDVLLFCKGEFGSIKLMMQGLITFSQAPKLSPNVGKSNFSITIQFLKSWWHLYNPHVAKPIP